MIDDRHLGNAAGRATALARVHSGFAKQPKQVVRLLLPVLLQIGEYDPLPVPGNRFVSG